MNIDCDHVSSECMFCSERFGGQPKQTRKFTIQERIDRRASYVKVLETGLKKATEEKDWNTAIGYAMSLKSTDYTIRLLKAILRDEED